MFRRLQDHRIARDQCWTKLPRCDDERIVPRHNRANDAERFFADLHQIIGRHWCDLVIHLVGEFGVILNAGIAIGHVNRERIADDFADIQRLKYGDGIGVFFDEFGKPQKDALFLSCRFVAPAAIFKRGAGRFHGGVDIGGIAIGNLPCDRSIHGGNFVECLAGERRDIVPVDKGAAFWDDCTGAGDPGFFGGWAFQHIGSLLVLKTD